MDKKPLKSKNKPGGDDKKKGIKNVGFISMLVLIGIVVYAASNQPSQLESKPYTQVVSEANEGKYKKLTISGGSVEVTEKDKDQPTIESQKDPNSTIAEDGIDTSKVEIEYKAPSEGGDLYFSGCLEVLRVKVIRL
jgi:preprotein translocase subunit YajC